MRLMWAFVPTQSQRSRQGLAELPTEKQVINIITNTPQGIHSR